MNRTKACRFLECWSDCLRLIAFASIIVEVTSLVRVKAQIVNTFALLTHLMTVLYIACCTPPFSSVVQLSSIEGITCQDCTLALLAHLI